MSRFRYEYRQAYREMINEENGGAPAPAGAMSASGANSVTGDSGGGTSDNQGSYGPSDARIMLPLGKKHMKRMFPVTTCVKTEGVSESCENCQCDKCQAEKGANLVETCKNQLKEFLGEEFEIEEYQDESFSPEELEECYMVTITKKGSDQGQPQTQPPAEGQASATKVCSTCNTMPCKCPTTPQQGNGDPNLQGEFQKTGTKIQ